MNRLFSVAALVAVLSGCAGLTPATLTGAARAKAAALPLALAVQDCVSGTEAAADFAPHFNALLDRLTAANNVALDETLVSAFVSAPAEVAGARADWTAARAVLTTHGVTCNPFVRQEAANVEATFLALERAVRRHERVVYYGEYALTLGRLFGVVPGGEVEVRRMEVSE